jgi:predicted  nucleic acid-binding Zn-ribbon protein
MSEAKQMRDKILNDIQALKQDNDSWKRQIKENEKKIVELEQIAKALENIGGDQ